MVRPSVLLVVASFLALGISVPGKAQSFRGLGTLREQAAVQQAWLDKRMNTVLPALMRKHKVGTWVIPMREYNEDPVFSSLVSPTTFAARRRTIYIFHDPCGPGGSPGCDKPIEKLALGGTSQGGVFTAVRSTKAASGPAGGQVQQNAELWGDEQWQVLVQEIEKRNPAAIHINMSRVFAFNDGLSSGELDGMREALGAKWAPRLKPADDLALDFIASRLPEEAEMFERMTRVVWGIIDTLGKALVLGLAAIAIAHGFSKTGTALRLRATREDEVAARSVGIGVTRERTIAFVISAGLVG